MFNKKTWIDRIVSFPGRRKLTDIMTGMETIVDVAREEGAVAKAGDAFNAKNMNDLEDRIEDTVNGLEERISASETKLLKEPHRNVNGFNGLTVYPSDVGNYRVASTRFAGLPDSCSLYGELHIYGQGYFTHIYRGLNDDMYIGQSQDRIEAPKEWHRVIYADSLKHMTVSATTSANGNIPFNLGTAKTAVVAAHISSVNSVATNTAYCLVSMWSGNDKRWGCKVINELSSSGVTTLNSTPVTVEVYYYDL